MKFRIARQEDIEALNTISILSKTHWGYPAEWIENWRDELTLNREKLARQNVLLAELNGQSIGFCSISREEHNYEVLHLWVLPEYIGKGYGKKLLQVAIERFVQDDKPIIVEADPNAEGFYKSQGFVTFDKIESYPKGRFLPVMQRG